MKADRRQSLSSHFLMKLVLLFVEKLFGEVPIIGTFVKLAALIA